MKLDELKISIHALREEGDRSASAPCRSAGHFYPRPPRGGRQDVKLSDGSTKTISIHALREEGDCRLQRHADDLQISIHALREEGDDNAAAQHNQQGDFYPRPPRGGRLALALDGREILHISIHALREEGDAAPEPGLLE